MFLLFFLKISLPAPLIIDFYHRFSVSRCCFTLSLLWFNFKR
jgi:hypothetical protein